MLATALFALMAVTVTDQTVAVQKGTRLDVSNLAGEVAVKVWDKDAVRVEVNHSERESIDIRQAEQVVAIRSHQVRGAPRSLDYAITVPRWMAISINGTYTDATLDGVGGDVTVETTRGDINVTGGSGVILLKSVSGDITVAKAKGRIDVRSVNESMTLSDITGDVAAETTNGSIILDRIDSSNVDLYTVNGNISYDGPIHDKGVYRLTTHNGMIGMAVPEHVNAMLLVRTYNGSFRSTFPVKQDDQNPRKRFTLTLGTGSARVELESFGGTIALRRPGEPRPEVERERHRRERQREKEKDKEKDKDRGDADIDVDVNVDIDVDAAVEGALEQVIPFVEEISDAAVRVHVEPVPRPVPLPRVRIK
jgi:DUF4097 and DUF4098 domain-containing protein YvlB